MGPRTKIPNALEMRYLKYGDRPLAERLELAETLRTLGRRSEALLLFERAPDTDFLAEEVRWAESEGIGFHLATMRAMGVEISPDSWRRCAEAAESRGRYLDARTCYVALEDAAALERINPHLPPSLQVEPATE